MSEEIDLTSRIRGVILGTAVGDALGLPAEGLGPKTIGRLWSGNWRHRLFFGKGMISDDTEHTLFVAQALLKHPDNAHRFQRSLAWKLRWWLLGLPAAVGFGTLRAIVKLWLFFPPGKSGVASAGNGPAMRSAILGVCFRRDRQKMRQMVRAATEITHKDARAMVGALAVSLAAAVAVSSPEGDRPDHNKFLDEIAILPGGRDEEWSRLVGQMKQELAADSGVVDFAAQMGLENGVTGYAYHTAPVAIYAWLRHYADFRSTLTEALNCGGDTDTVGAIAGALAGAAVGEEGIPREWIEGIWDWPRGAALCRAIADELARQQQGRQAGPVSYFWPAAPVRNLLFLAIVLFHGFLRLVPAGLRRRIGV